MSTCPFKAYKDVFGRVGTGLHKHRLVNTAIVDYMFTILGAMGVTALTGIPLSLTTIVALVLGVVAHFLFGVDTPDIKYLGLSCP